MSRDDPFDLLGDILDGQYRVDAVAGEGDLSVVYRGHHLGVDAPVAIKCLNLPATLDPVLMRPLVEDFREASRVHYRLARGNLHIAQSLGAGQTIAPRTGATVPYLVREWFDGESLAADLQQRRSDGKKGRPIEEAVALLEPAIEALMYAHEQGTPHLSVNPSNLFIARRDGARSLKVLDFGVARAMNEVASGLQPETQSTRGLRVLFPAYAAPEQLDRTVGETGPWTDVYAIALVFLELLSDRIVMQGSETGALVERALHEKRPTPAAHGLHLSRNLELVLARAVAMIPTRRQKDAGSFWRDVKVARSPSATRSIPKPACVPRLAQSPTLMGIAPTSAVVGAVPGRSRAPSAPRVETKPMSFEPEPPASSIADEPPPVQTVTAKLPPPLSPPALHSPTPPAWAILPPRARSPAAVIALVSGGSLLMLALVACLIAFVAGQFRHGVATVPAVARLVSSAEPEIGAHPIASAAVLAPPVDSAPVASTAPPVSARFSSSAAGRALDAVSRDVAACKLGPRWGVGRATVTFDTDGSVQQVFVGPPFTGTANGRCVGDLLGAVRIPAFVGVPVVYATPVYVAPR